MYPFKVRQRLFFSAIFISHLIYVSAFFRSYENDLQVFVQLSAFSTNSSFFQAVRNLDLRISVIFISPCFFFSWFSWNFRDFRDILFQRTFSSFQVAHFNQNFTLVCKILLQFLSNYPVNIYWFRVNNRNPRKRRDMFRVNNKNTIATSLTSLQCFYCSLLSIFCNFFQWFYC